MKEAQALFGIGRTQLMELVKRGLVKARQTDGASKGHGHWRIDRASLEAHFNAKAQDIADQAIQLPRGDAE